MAKIKEITAREIFDSRGNPTVETKVFLEDGSWAISSVPSGASTGKHEALELRDNDMFRYRGMGVLKAVENVNKILGPQLLGWESAQQEKIDLFLIEEDGTEDKSKFGANAILSISQAVCEAQAKSIKSPNYKHVGDLFFKITGTKYPFKIPTPFFNLINGGRHGAGNNLNFQEFQIIPAKKISFIDSLLMTDSIYGAIGQVLKEQSDVFLIGDEGGYAPNFINNEKALEFLVNCGKTAGFSYLKDFFVGLDLAANSFYDNGQYKLTDFKKPIKADVLTNFYLSLADKFSLFSLEDPFTDESWGDWNKLLMITKKVLIIGDDLLCTNVLRIQKAIEFKACNCVLIKPNQIGTITETIKAVDLAKKSGLKVVVSHRSGETNEDFIADFAVGVGADMIKFGAPAKKERAVKYNRLQEIEKEITG